MIEYNSGYAMNKVLRAYSVNQVNEAECYFHLVVCCSIPSRLRNLILYKEIPNLLDGETSQLIELVGRVPESKAKDFPSKSIHIGGLPTKEERTEEGFVLVSLGSLLERCEPLVIPPKEGDILIINEYDIESQIGFITGRE